MSLLDDLITKLSEKNLSDADVDKILNAGINIASLLGNGEEVKESLNKLKLMAENKKQNKDIQYIDKLNTPKDLNDAINIYNNRVDKGYTNYEGQALLAEKLGNMSETDVLSTKDLYTLSNNLMKDDGILEYGTDAQKEIFAGNLCTAYAFSVDSTRTPGEVSKILDNVRDLAMYTECPDWAIANVATRLDNKKIAQKFIKYSEEILDKMDEKGMEVSGAHLIDAYKNIVKNHPEMAKKCNELVKKATNLTGDENVLETAKKYCQEVDKTNGVDAVDKALARSYSRHYNARYEKAKAKRQKVEKNTKSMNRTIEMDYDYGMEM